MDTLEPLSLWQVPKSGKNKGRVIPKPFNPNQSLWQSFGLLTKDKYKHIPRIIDWINEHVIDDLGQDKITKIVAVGTSHNSDASSMLNEITSDSLYLHLNIVKGYKNNKWMDRIDDEVDITKNAIQILKNFARDLMDIRNNRNAGLANNIERQAYFAVDDPFKNWIMNINDTSTSNDILDWHNELKSILINLANDMIYPLDNRELIGNTNSKGRYENVAIQNMIFRGQLNKILYPEADK